MDYKSEKIKPYDGQQDKTGQVEQMFNSIAPAYDFMNHAMTLGIDKLWRRTAVRMIAKVRPQRILDVATGTGDFAIDLCRKLSPESVVGFDLTAGMLDVARRKVAKLGLDSIISFKQGNCAEMSDFANDSFDAINATDRIEVIFLFMLFIYVVLLTVQKSVLCEFTRFSRGRGIAVHTGRERDG